MAPIIEAQGLTKRYGDTHALAGLDLVAEGGRVTALLGPNGAGKTTFISAVATLLLDTTKCIGFLVVTGLEFDLVMVAAILTVVGFSTNDKVVVYDRMRENLRKYKTMPLRQLIDLSINETLNRTLGTSMTTFLASLPLALFGGASLSGFAWMMLFGIVIGTSSSIFIAAPILLFLGENRLRRDAQPAKSPAGAPG